MCQEKLLRENQISKTSSAFTKLIFLTSEKAKNLILTQLPIYGRSALSKLLHHYSPELGWLADDAVADLGDADERRIIDFEEERRLGDLVAGHVDVHGESPHLHRFEGYVEEAIVLLEPEEMN